MASARTFSTRRSEETRRLGSQLGHVLTAGMVVALSGDLGAGKTTLTQGIATGMGVQARVTSPTFTLVNEYESQTREAGKRLRLIHLDSYRLGDSDADSVPEAATFGVEEVLDDEDAVVVIEWAERLAPLLPVDHLQITLSHDNADVDVRRVEMIATGPRSAEILGRLGAVAYSETPDTR